GIRECIKVGDNIGCQGEKIISKIIRRFKGGRWNLSHIAVIIRDVTNEGTGRVEVLEAVGKGGMQRNYLSKIYEANHGKLFWIQTGCNCEERKAIMEMGAEIIGKKIKYDFKSTWLAVFSPIFMDAKKFNCSEVAWYLLTKAGKFAKRYDGKKQIAPVPGDLPDWIGVEPIEIDM
ncbi:unnamed protein product, partial [marine sediment metagenome]